MNPLIIIPFALAVLPLIPAFIEIFRRKDKGPRKIPEETIHEERPDISKPVLDLKRARDSAQMGGESEVIRVVGDVSIPDETEIKEHIVVQGSLKIGKRCHLHGSVKTSKEVEVGAESIVEEHILSEGKVTIGSKAVVKGIIDSKGDIILKEDAVVEAVSTEKSVEVGVGAKIQRGILAGASIHTSPPSRMPTPAVEARPEKPIIDRMKTLKVNEQPAHQVSSAIEDLFEAKASGETDDIKEKLFKHLEDRIRELSETERSRETDGGQSEELSSSEEKTNDPKGQNSPRNHSSRWAWLPSFGFKAMVLLQVLALGALLAAEIAYYNSVVFSSLDRIMPLNIRLWMLFLGLSAICGLLGVISAWRFKNYAKRD